MSAWRWTDERGVQRLVSTAELRSALAAGVIPGSTLVWRQGMEAWAPASRQPELADAAQLRRKPEASAAAEKPSAPARDAARESSVELELELVEDLDPAPPLRGGQRVGPAPTDSAANERKPPAQTSRATSRPHPPPPPPRKRESMRTLTGVDVPPSAPASGPSAPIVVPAAGGTFDAGVARAITQLPRYDSASPDDQGAAVIPRAPKLPSESEEREEREETSAGERPAADAGIAATGGAVAATDDAEAAPPRAKGAAAPSRPGALRRAAGGPASRLAARPPHPPPRPPGRDAAPGSAAPSNPGCDSATDTVEQGAGRPLPATPPSSSRGATRRPSPGRSVPPPPVPVRYPAVPARRPAIARAPELPDQTAAGAKALVRLGSLPAPPPLPPASSPRAAPQPVAAPPHAASATPADAAHAPSAAAASASPGPRPASPAPPADAPLPRSAEDAAANDGRDPSASRAHGEAPEPSTTLQHGEVGERAAAPAPDETKRSPLPGAPPPGEGAQGRREYATIPSLGAGSGASQERPAGRSSPGLLPGLQGAQRGPAGADAPPAPGLRGDRSSGTSSSNGLPALAARRAQPAPAGGSRPLPQGDRKTLSTAVPVPVSSLFGLGGAAVLMSVVAFFAGRHSVAAARSAPVETARTALGAAQDVARSAVPAPPKPCWVARQPQQWAPLVAKSIPFEVTATRSGKLVVGYAKSTLEAVGLEIDPATGERNERFSNREAADIVSISPVEDSFTVLTAAQQAIRSPVSVPGPTPFVVGLADGAVVAADNPGAAPLALWPVQGDEPLEAPRAIAAGPRGHAIAFRRDKAVWAGWLDADRKPVGELTRVAGSGGAVGKPSLGWNERDLAVVFADRPADGRWEIRAGQAPLGTLPGSTQVIPLPSGGPGGDAFAPDIAGLSEGRWLLVWTEGPPGSRAMRAQTLSASLAPIGDPIALSPPAGNFGQGVLGVVPRAGYVGVVFLSKPAASYELWGVILQCG